MISERAAYMYAYRLGFLDHRHVRPSPETTCYTYPVSGQDPQNDQKPSLTADLKRLWAAAVKIGAALAITCHLLPPHYQAACHAISTLCGGN